MIVIGDIHGCAKTLERLLAQIPAGAEIYSTGDLIDRGPDSRRVVSICMERGIRAVMGNHEHMLLDYLDGTGKYGSGVFMMNGGMKTLDSYGGKMDPAHLDFMRSLPLCIETEHFILSHAGVCVMKTLNEACDLDSDLVLNILWNRGGLADLGKIQIVGHTPNRDVVEYFDKEEVVGINIDTGAVYPYFGRLTAVSLPDMEFIQIGCID